MLLASIDRLKTNTNTPTSSETVEFFALVDACMEEAAVRKRLFRDAEEMKINLTFDKSLVLEEFRKDPASAFFADWHAQLFRCMCEVETRSDFEFTVAFSDSVYNDHFNFSGPALLRHVQSLRSGHDSTYGDEDQATNPLLTTSFSHVVPGDAELRHFFVHMQIMIDQLLKVSTCVGFQSVVEAWSPEARQAMFEKATLFLGLLPTLRKRGVGLKSLMWNKMLDWCMKTDLLVVMEVCRSEDSRSEHGDDGAERVARSYLAHLVKERSAIWLPVTIHVVCAIDMLRRTVFDLEANKVRKCKTRMDLFKLIADFKAQLRETRKADKKFLDSQNLGL